MRKTIMVLIAGLSLFGTALADTEQPPDVRTTFEEVPHPASGAATSDGTIQSTVSTTPKPEGAHQPGYASRRYRGAVTNDTSLSNDATTSGDNLPPPIPLNND